MFARGLRVFGPEVVLLWTRSGPSGLFAGGLRVFGINNVRNMLRFEILTCIPVVKFRVKTLKWNFQNQKVELSVLKSGTFKGVKMLVINNVKKKSGTFNFKK